MKKFEENVSRPGIIDARAKYRAAARRLRNTALENERIIRRLDVAASPSVSSKLLDGVFRISTRRVFTKICREYAGCTLK